MRVPECVKFNDLGELEKAIIESAADNFLSRLEAKRLWYLFSRADIGRHELIDFAFLYAESILISTNKNIGRWLRSFVLLLSGGRPEKHLEPGVWFSPGHEIRAVIVNCVGRARRNIKLSVFTITDHKIASALKRAIRRRVKVIVVTDLSTANNRGSKIDCLREMGAHVYRLDLGPSSLMHNKYAIFDDEFVLSGSYNWTIGATRNRENLFLVDRKDQLAAFCQDFDSHLGLFQM